MAKPETVDPHWVQLQRQRRLSELRPLLHRQVNGSGLPAVDKARLHTTVDGLVTLAMQPDQSGKDAEAVLQRVLNGGRI